MLTDRLSLSLMSELVSVQSNSGRADPRTVIAWPGAEVAQWLCLLLTDCTSMLKNRDSLVFELGGIWARTHTQPFYGSPDFLRNNPGEPVPEETFTHSHLM